MDKLRPESGFDYGDLPADVADQLRRHAAEVKRNVANALPYLVEAGAELAKAKEKLRYRRPGFVEWVKAEAGISTAHAYNLLAIHEKREMFLSSGNIAVGYKTAVALTKDPIALEKVQARAVGDQDVRQGTRRDAILHSVGANAQHGLRRTNADKRKSVELALSTERGKAASDRAIADQCGVSHPTVMAVRATNWKSLPVEGEPETRTGLDGKARRMPKAKNPNPQPEEETPSDEVADEPAEGDTQEGEGRHPSPIP